MLTRVARVPARAARCAAPSSSSSSTRRLAITKSASPASASDETAQLLQELRTSIDRYPLIDPVWTSRIDRALTDFQRAPRPARLAIVGSRESAAEGLVTALLDDPLASNPDVTVALEARRLQPDVGPEIVIQYGDEVHASPQRLQLPVPWLDRTQTEIVEMVDAGVSPLESSLTTLHLADLVIVVLSDSTLLSSKSAQALLHNLAAKPNLVLALNCPDASTSSSTSPLRNLEHQLNTLFPAAAEAGSEPRVLVVSTAQALTALEALSPSEPDQPPNYTQFQKGYVASRIPHLHQLLTSALTASHADHLDSPPTPLQLQTAQYILSAALSRTAFAGAQVADALSEADSALSALETHAQEAENALLASLGVEASTGLLRVPADEHAAANHAFDELFATRLQWYKLPYRVDDLSAEVALVASQTFLPRFERRLAFAAGLAASTSAALSARVDALFHATPQFAHSPTRTGLSPAARLSSLYSATLLNALDQASHTTSSSLSPASSSSPAAATAAPDLDRDAAVLSGAVVSRRAQLTAPGGPASTLHRRAQRAVLRSGTLATASVAGAIASDLLGWVAQTGTSLGAGLLGVTVAAWGLQRAWLRAVKRFRQDVDRVVGAVEEDAGVRARGLAARAAWKATVAVRLGREKVRGRRAEWDGWRAEWGRIQERADRIGATRPARRVLAEADDVAAAQCKVKQRAAA